jgi:AcrR family transcriptional regulator
VTNPTAERPGQDVPADPHQRDETITAAVIELLRTKGPKAVNVEAVAAQAGVAKTTIYRRYRDRDEMIAAALTSLTSPPPPPDTSSLQPVLQWVIEQSFNAIESGIGLGGVAALLTDDDSRFTALIRGLLVEHRAALAAVVEDAAAAGQLRADLDVDTMLDCIVGAYLAERARSGKVLSGWAQRISRALWPAIAAAP